MQYVDGDNQKETATKVLAARHAIAQTMADYKVLTGRGVICCFPGGDLPNLRTCLKDWTKLRLKNR